MNFIQAIYRLPKKIKKIYRTIEKFENKLIRNKWSNIFNKILINKSLRLILKVIYNENHLPSVTVNKMFKKLEFFNLSDIHRYFCLKLIHELLYGSKTHKFTENFLYLLPDHTYNTRGIQINLPRIRLNIIKTLPLYTCINLINNLPNSLIEPQSSITLKKRFKEYVLQSY